MKRLETMTQRLRLTANRKGRGKRPLALLRLALFLALPMAVGCSEDSPGSEASAGTNATGPANFAQNFNAGASQTLCTVGSQISCACVAGASGTQTCLASGRAYGPCMGCPAATTSAATMTTPMTGAAGGMSNAPTAPSTDPNAIVISPADMTGGGAGAINGEDETMGGMAGAAGDVLQTEVLGVAPAGTEPGTSCGVGLPVLCALESEQCCIRSLETDSCIGIDESCTCGPEGCTTSTARCDGPEDCPEGQVCCGTLATSRSAFGGGGNSYDKFECASQCDSVGNASGQREACHEDKETCPSGTVCMNSQILTNLQICIAPSSIDQ